MRVVKAAAIGPGEAVRVPADGQPRLSRAFDLTVLAMAAVLVLATVEVTGSRLVGLHADALSIDDPTTMDFFLVWIAVPLIALFSRYPVHLDRPGGSIEIGVDSCVLAYLGAVADRPYQAVLLWAVGAVVAQCVDYRRMVARVFNVGVMTASGAAALWLMDLLLVRFDAQDRSLAEFLAVMIGCTAYLAFDFVISEVSVALESGDTTRRQLVESGVLISMVILVAVDSLGYLAAEIQRALPPAVMLLLAVPVLALLVAARSTTRDRERSRRMRVLFDVSRSVQSQTSAEDVLSVLEPGAQDLIRVAQTRIRETPPTRKEVGARVTDGTRDWWLVAPEWSRLRATVSSDAEHLDQLALAGSEALSRLKLTREMTYLARHDTLTQLANRDVFLDRVEHALQLARRRHSRVAVLFCDLDGFKQVNDRFGHGAGDAVLVTVAARIRRCVRASDTVARLGGDEFAILLEDVQDPDDIDRVSSSVLAAVVERAELNGHFVTVSTSIGVATSDGDDTGDTVLRSADMAMYEAKALGKNCVARYQPEFGTARVRKLEMVEAFRAALDAGEISVAYQPVVEVRTGAVVGLEALARWRHGEHDISPAQFVPLAEETGLVVPLGEHVLDIVAHDAAALGGFGPYGSPLELAVNISAQQLRSPAFVDKVRDATESLRDVDLVLEVTERDVVREDSLSLDAMRRLVEAGVRFAVDDFGVGFSSIGYLQNLPVHILKTDKTFAANIDHSARSVELLRSMLLMGQAMGLDVVVEGVERQGQLDRLRDMRYDVYAQGFLIGRPVSLAEAVASIPTAQPAQPLSDPEPVDGWAQLSVPPEQQLPVAAVQGAVTGPHP
ncbi:MAG: bifunctional diguanylate cyclase/phosphodiesterase [Nocardioidaceae bacterium]|nr:bifunctional diguanylate cyclase/phosphodiesterase [Nocardioidaceae bacterium]